MHLHASAHPRPAEVNAQQKGPRVRVGVADCGQTGVVSFGTIPKTPGYGRDQAGITRQGEGGWCVRRHRGGESKSHTGQHMGSLGYLKHISHTGEVKVRATLNSTLDARDTETHQSHGGGESKSHIGQQMGSLKHISHNTFEKRRKSRTLV